MVASTGYGIERTVIVAISFIPELLGSTRETVCKILASVTRALAINALHCGQIRKLTIRASLNTTPSLSVEESIRV